MFGFGKNKKSYDDQAKELLDSKYEELMRGWCDTIGKVADKIGQKGASTSFDDRIGAANALYSLLSVMIAAHFRHPDTNELQLSSIEGFFNSVLSSFDKNLSVKVLKGDASSAHMFAASKEEVVAALAKAKKKGSPFVSINGHDVPVEVLEEIAGHMEEMEREASDEAPVKSARPVLH